MWSEKNWQKPQVLAENIEPLSKEGGKKKPGKGSTSESLMAAQKEKHKHVPGERAGERADEVANCLGG